MLLGSDRDLTAHKTVLLGGTVVIVRLGGVCLGLDDGVRAVTAKQGRGTVVIVRLGRMCHDLGLVAAGALVPMAVGIALAESMLVGMSKRRGDDIAADRTLLCEVLGGGTA